MYANLLPKPEPGGWRPEKAYTNGCLIGNWFEDRLQYPKGPTYQHDSATRIDFPLKKVESSSEDGQGGDDGAPDVLLRKVRRLQQEGLPKQFLMDHHGKAYYDNYITWYDEHYNKRPRAQDDKLPDLRTWDLQSIAWIPERSDFPMKGKPTNWGLRDQQTVKWKQREKESMPMDTMSRTVYRDSYNREMDRASFPVRYRRTNVRDSALVYPNNNKYEDTRYRNLPWKYGFPETFKHVSTRPRHVQEGIVKVGLEK